MNKKIKISGLLLFALACCLVTINSCKKDTPYTANYQYDYYPLDTGHYVIYDVDSIFYSYNGTYTRDTVHYQWKVLVADTFYDNLNQLNYRLECYRRSDSVSPWNAQVVVWSALRATTNMQVDEDDIRFVKLVFPPALNETWTGNEYVPTSSQYSVFTGWNYFYENTDTTYILNGTSYTNALIASEVNQENLIQKTLRTEVYAKGVGMIYEEWEALNKQNVNADWNTGPENGFRIRMRVYDHN